MRGVLDSSQDFELCILARELDAGVATEKRVIGSFSTLLAEYLRLTAAEGYE